MSIDPIRPAKPQLSRTSSRLLTGGLILTGVAAAAALWYVFGTSSRRASTPADHLPANPPPVVIDRAPPPPVPAAKTYTEDEVKIIRDLTRTQTLTEAALERQYGN
jgi:hypothetical protein